MSSCFATIYIVVAQNVFRQERKTFQGERKGSLIIIPRFVVRIFDRRFFSKYVILVGSYDPTVLCVVGITIAISFCQKILTVNQTDMYNRVDCFYKAFRVDTGCRIVKCLIQLARMDDQCYEIQQPRRPFFASGNVRYFSVYLY